MAATRNRPPPDPVAALRAGLGRAAAALDRDSPAGLRCLAGLSGGRDSVVLLHALAGLREETGIALSALHVHHGLSPRADDWAAFCTGICAAFAVPLTVERVAVDRAGGKGLEAAARSARYAALAAAADAADLVVLAHHSGDQAETLLFNLLRGAGLAGASAMAPLRRLAGGRLLLRPWLEVSPESIADYRERFGLAHVDDESNADTAFSRNFLRHEVLAPVEARFPGAALRLAGAARRLGEARGLLAELADADLAALGAAEVLPVAGLEPLSPARRRNALRRWLELHSTGLGEEALEDLLAQLAQAGPAARVRVRAGGAELRLWRGALHRVPAVPEDLPAPRAWAGEASAAWAGGILRCEAVAGEGIRVATGPCELRRRRGGERLRLHADGPTRPLRLLFQEAGWPPWVRDRLPLVWQGDALVAVPGIGVGAGFRAGPGEAGWQLRWSA